MAFTPKAGHNGLIYVSGQELEGANTWGVNLGHEAVDVSRFGTVGRKVLAGLQPHSGSMKAWHDQTKKVLQEAMVYDGLVAWSIYPDRGSLTTYYSGNAVFSGNSEGSMTAGVAVTANFENDGVISMTGFT